MRTWFSNRTWSALWVIVLLEQRTWNWDTGGGGSVFFSHVLYGRLRWTSYTHKQKPFPLFSFPPSLSSIAVSLLLPILCSCSWFIVCKFLHSGWRREEVASLSLCDVVWLKLFRSLHLSTIFFQSTSPSKLLSFCFPFNIYWMHTGLLLWRI
jgi:hypothetical protein